jgi:predicted RecA/RadA family phage recombinase
MAKAVFLQEGAAIDHVPAADLPAGAVVLQGDAVGITRTPIAAGRLGSLALAGVFEVPKQAGLALPAGSILYWDVTTETASLKPTAVLLGYSIREALAADATVQVRLGGRLSQGPLHPILVPVDAPTVIAVGDLLWLDTDDAKPAALQPDQGTEAANQELFHDRFLGVALQPSAAGETSDILVGTSGMFEFAMLSGTAQLGELFGVDENAAGNGLLNQQVDQVAAPNLALGRCARHVAVATDRVWVEIVSTVLRGGPQAIL